MQSRTLPNIRIAVLCGIVLLSCAIAPAQAVERNWRGSGEVLILPFFNSLNGWDTYLNLSMLPYERGIFRLRILDGDTGRAVNGFNIYSYWSENWRASITQVDGGTVLRIAEGSCTLAGDGTFGGAGTEFALGADVGIVEVYAVSRRINSSLREETCDDIAARWEPGGAWAQDPDADLRVWENSRVGGQVGLVQVQSGLSAEYQAIALSEFADDIAHTHPASGSPSLADAAPIARLESGEAFTPDSGEGIDAVAALLMPFQDSITNDVVRAQDIDANTEWIVTFPLKGYKTFGPDVVEIDGEPRDCTSLGQAEEPGKPFLERRAESPWLIWAGGDSWGGFSDLAPLPIVRVKAALCRAVNLIAFGNSESMFLPDDSVLRERMLDSGFSFPLFIEAPSLGAQLYLGSAPVVGFRATTFVNGTLQGGKVLANYMLLRPHRVE